MYASWGSTQFWFSILVVSVATALTGTDKMDGGQWMIAVTAAIALFGGRKMIEHRNNKKA